MSKRTHKRIRLYQYYHMMIKKCLFKTSIIQFKKVMKSNHNSKNSYKSNLIIQFLNKKVSNIKLNIQLWLLRFIFKFKLIIVLRKIKTKNHLPINIIQALKKLMIIQCRKKIPMKKIPHLSHHLSKNFIQLEKPLLTMSNHLEINILL
jgi:hypothetical protein